MKESINSPWLKLISQEAEAGKTSNILVETTLIYRSIV